MDQDAVIQAHIDLELDNINIDDERGNINLDDELDDGEDVTDVKMIKIPPTHSCFSGMGLSVRKVSDFLPVGLKNYLFCK